MLFCNLPLLFLRCNITSGVDSGNPSFGPISVVFNASYARPSTYYNAVDSGVWEGVCNTTYNHNTPDGFWPGPFNCSQSTVPGTHGALNHVLLASELLWKPAKESGAGAGAGAARHVSSPIISTFRRLYQYPPPQSSTVSQIQYLEPDIAGAVHIPDGIKFVIGMYSSLFGTSDGRMLQAWCIANGWALLWSPGFKCASGSTEKLCVDTFFGHNGTTPFRSPILSSGAV